MTSNQFALNSTKWSCRIAVEGCQFSKKHVFITFCNIKLNLTLRIGMYKSSDLAIKLLLYYLLVDKHVIPLDKYFALRMQF
jgi:hypothetical protein